MQCYNSIGAIISCQVQIHVYQGEDEENRGRFVKFFLSLFYFDSTRLAVVSSLLISFRYYSEEASEGLEGYSDSSQGMPELEYR